VSPALVGVAVGVVAFAVFVALTPRSAKSNEVLVVARPVTAGATVRASDLRVGAVSAPKSVAVVLARDERSVVGKAARTDLAPGTLLTMAGVGPPAPRGAVVGVELKPGRYPPGLAAGDRVQVLAVAASAESSDTVAEAGPAAGLSAAATVESTRPTSTDATVMVGLSVSPSEAVTIAQAGAADRVVLVTQR
jgi:hypothetical protein